MAEPTGHGTGRFPTGHHLWHASISGDVGHAVPRVSPPGVETQVEIGLRRRLSPDLLGVLALVALTGIAAWPLLHDGTILGQDTATFFYPMYHYLGEQLRAFHLPGWNPSQFSGTPFAADPESGWMYLPAMLFFTVLPFAAAISTFVLFHLLLAAIATYSLARVLGLEPIGAVAAAVAFTFSETLYGRVAGSSTSVEVAAWAPLMLLGAELALRNRSWLTRVAWWGVAGLAVSQILAAWLGQVSYYALLALGAYLVYRTLIAPTEPVPSFRRRVGRLMLHGAVILAFGFGLAAAGVLPRLEYNGLSNLPDGIYHGVQAWAATAGGWSVANLATLLQQRLLAFPPDPTVILACAAPFVARRRFGVPYFAAIGIAGLILSLPTTTPLHALLYAVLPYFHRLHQHYPERIMYVASLGPALLVGATVNAVTRRRRAALIVAIAALLPLPMVAVIARQPDRFPLLAVSALAVATPCILLAIRPRGEMIRRAAPLALVFLLFAGLVGAEGTVLAHGPANGLASVTLEDYYEPTGAVSFLQSVQATEPGRFFGYDPSLQTSEPGQLPAIYRAKFAASLPMELLVNNRATLFGLQDIQGYNPVRLAGYAAMIRAMNGQTQDYHEADVLPSGLTSPLLDLLNARYIVIPATIPANRPDLQNLVRHNPTVYLDGEVRVLKNQAALPRAWLVHSAQQTTPSNALSLLATGEVNPRQTALLSTPPPTLAQPAEASADRTTMTSYHADRVELHTASGAASLLMLSEVYYPAWHASVDGKPVPLLKADGVLRAVPVPKGAHTVVLSYDDPALHLGLAISLFAAGVLAMIGVALLSGHRRRTTMTRADSVSFD